MGRKPVKKLPLWEYMGKEVESIKDVPEKAYGFVYVVDFDDGTRYVGKKVFYVKRTRKATTAVPKEGCERHFRNTGMGHRIAFDTFTEESNWKRYYGTFLFPAGMKVVRRTILAYAFTKLQLTYLEAKYQFILEVLEKPEFWNKNILGSFYRNVNDRPEDNKPGKGD